MSELAAILAALAAFGGLILSVVRFWISRAEKRAAHLSAKLDELLQVVASGMAATFASADARTYVTIDYRMDGTSDFLRIPIGLDRVTECLPGMRLQLLSQTARETTYSISTLGAHQPLRFHWHYHEEAESIQVIRGTVLDVRTGRRYAPGETWTIAAGERHIADFDNAYVIATIRPPLPSGADAPIKLEGMTSVYQAPPPADYQP